MVVLPRLVLPSSRVHRCTCLAFLGVVFFLGSFVAPFCIVSTSFWALSPLSGFSSPCTSDFPCHVWQTLLYCGVPVSPGTCLSCFLSLDSLVSASPSCICQFHTPFEDTFNLLLDQSSNSACWSRSSLRRMCIFRRVPKRGIHRFPRTLISRQSGRHSIRLDIPIKQSAALWQASRSPGAFAMTATVSDVGLTVSSVI